ncbi:MAG: RDD family protein [Verrucomicrobiota bacterium]
MSALRIRTPDGIEFALPLAGPVSRFLAWGIDFAVAGAAWVLLVQGLALVQLVSADLASVLLLGGTFLLPLAYSLLFEWHWRGRTPGKRALGLRVVDAEGLRLQPAQIILRNLLRAVDFLPAGYLLGGLACSLHPRHQRLGDLAANTVVIRTPRLEQPDLDEVLTDLPNSLRSFPHLAARLREQVPAAEAALALEALARRDQLAPPARLALFQELAALFRRRLRFPAGLVEDLADEALVRNVVDVVHRPTPRRSAAPSPPAAAPPHGPEAAHG